MTPKQKAEIGKKIASGLKSILRDNGWKIEKTEGTLDAVTGCFHGKGKCARIMLSPLSDDIAQIAIDYIEKRMKR